MTGGASASKAPLRPRMLAMVASMAAVAYGIDFASKEIVLATMREGQTIPAIGELLQWRFVRNPGAAFSLASGSTWIFTILSAAVAIFIVSQARRIGSKRWAFALGGVLGGTLGNLTDRLFREPDFFVGHVVDMISVWGFPAIFNFADVFIVSSMGAIVLLVLNGIGIDGRKRTHEPAKSEAAGVDPADDGEAASTASDR